MRKGEPTRQLQKRSRILTPFFGNLIQLHQKILKAQGKQKKEASYTSWRPGNRQYGMVKK